jgi:hypothetical protein
MVASDEHLLKAIRRVVQDRQKGHGKCAKQHVSWLARKYVDTSHFQPLALHLFNHNAGTQRRAQGM